MKKELTSIFCLAIVSFNYIMAQKSNTEWIENDKVFEALENKSKPFFDKMGNQICVSWNYDYCLLLRNQSAWFIKNQGWRDSNLKPQNSEDGRLILNFYKIDSENGQKIWFKIFVPLKYIKDCKVETIDNKKYKITSSDGLELIGTFDNFDSLMWDFLSGNAEMEAEIESKFNKIGI